MSKTPTLVQGSIKAAPTTNTDPRGRPSPIVVRVYELKSISAFNNADFFSRFDKDSETRRHDDREMKSRILENFQG